MNANTEFLSIKEVVEDSGLSEVYVRRMISKGKIKTTKVTLPSQKGFKHMIRRTDYLQWRETSSHNRRNDGRGRFLLYGTPEEIQILLNLVEKSGLGVIITRQNQVKSEVSEEENES